MPEQTIYDIHIATLQVMEREMERLHQLIQRGDDDNDVTQDQLGKLHEELVRLSAALSAKECE